MLLSCNSKVADIRDIDQFSFTYYTLRDIENSAPRRKHRIEMKFYTRINKDERFT